MRLSHRSGGMILLGVLVLFSAVMIVNLVNDVNLGAEIRNLAVTDIPDIRLENIRFEREIWGSLWKVRIPGLERLGGVVSISSFDILRELPNGDVWEISGSDGEYLESSETAMFYGISGSADIGSRFFDLYAPCVSWEKSGDLVVLPRGFAIRGGADSLSAERARVEAGNVITIEEGGKIVWNISSGDIRE